MSTQQARSLGLSGRYLAQAGRWERISCRVYRNRAWPTCWRQRLMAAVLAGGDGALVSHRAAAAMWGLDGGFEELVEVTVPRSHRGKQVGQAIVHCSPHLDHVDAYKVDQIPVTGVTRTLIDLAAVVDHDTLETALESGLRSGRTTLRDLERRLQALGSRGRPGKAMMRAVLAERMQADPTESELETRFVQLCRRAGLPIPVRQYKVGGQFRCDFAFPDQRLLVEVDGFAYHSSRSDHQSDLTRQNTIMLARPDWVVLRYSRDDVVDRPARVAHQLRGALALQTQRTAPPVVDRNARKAPKWR